MTTTVSLSIKILVSNLVVAALVATYLTSGSKNGTTVGLKGARQLQPTTFFNGGFTPGPNLPTFSFTPIAFDQIKFTPSKVPSVGDFISNRNFTSSNFPSSTISFFDQVNANNLNFTASNVPSQTISFFDQVNINNLNFTASNVPSQTFSFFDQVNANNLNFTASNVPSQTISFLDQVNINNLNFTSSNIPSVGNFLSSLDFTNSNIFGPGGRNNLDKLPPGQGFIQFPSP
jgi:hypothetical protein